MVDHYLVKQLLSLSTYNIYKFFFEDPRIVRDMDSRALQNEFRITHLD